MVELFLELFDILGPELLALMEEFRLQGKVCGALNANFIALIPKISTFESFNDVRPISLCNLVYKLTSKIIANKIKPMLSTFMSKE